MSYQGIKAGSHGLIHPDVRERTMSPLSSRLSWLYLTGKDGLQVQHIPYVLAAYAALAILGAFVFALANGGWRMLIPAAVGVIGASYFIFLLQEQYKGGVAPAEQGRDALRKATRGQSSSSGAAR